MDKAEIRKLGKKGRASVQGEVRKEYQRRICERIRESKEYRNAETILSYQAFGSEVCLTRLNQWAIEDGKRLAYPYCTDRTTMIALVPQGEDSWGEDLYGILVPLPEKSTLLKPEDIDLVLAPLVAFDEHANRTGMGAGAALRRYVSSSDMGDFRHAAANGDFFPLVHPAGRFRLSATGRLSA